MTERFLPSDDTCQHHRHLHLLLPTLDYVVEESGKAAVKAEGVSSVTFMNGKAVLELQSGTYQFVVKKENK